MFVKCFFSVWLALSVVISCAPVLLIELSVLSNFLHVVHYLFWRFWFIIRLNTILQRVECFFLHFFGYSASKAYVHVFSHTHTIKNTKIRKCCWQCKWRRWNAKRNRATWPFYTCHPRIIHFGWGWILMKLEMKQIYCYDFGYITAMYTCTLFWCIHCVIFSLFYLTYFNDFFNWCRHRVSLFFNAVYLLCGLRLLLSMKKHLVFISLPLKIAIVGHLFKQRTVSLQIG